MLTHAFDPIPPLPCVCFPPDDAPGCVCCPLECLLRTYATGIPMPPMTPAQREACMADAVWHEEGSRREDYASLPDAALAQAVVDAWLTYCRDKGLL